MRRIPLMRRMLCLLPLVAAIWAADAPAARAESAWRWPLPPPEKVVRGFEPPAHDWLPGHRGVDLAGRVGDRVLAAGAGTVAFAGRVGGVSIVAIRHANGLETTYQPVHPLVRVGESVIVGAALGVLVRPGSHCLPQACLHWGLRRGDTYLDPLALVGQVRVRLLPMLSGAGHASWVTPAVSGASVGSSAVAGGWALTLSRRRRRRLPPGVASLDQARAQRRLVSSCCSKCSP